MNSKAGFSAIECRRQDSFNRAVSGVARHCGCLRQLLVLPFAQAQATHAADRVDGLPWGWGLASSFPPENASKIRVHFSISLNRKNSESRLTSTAAVPETTKAVRFCCRFGILCFAGLSFRQDGCVWTLRADSQPTSAKTIQSLNFTTSRRPLEYHFPQFRGIFSGFCLNSNAAMAGGYLPLPEKQLASRGQKDTLAIAFSTAVIQTCILCVSSVSLAVILVLSLEYMRVP